MSLRSLGPQPTKGCPVSAAWCWLGVPRSCVCPDSGGWCGFVLGCLLPSLLPRADAPSVVIQRRTLTCLGAILRGVTRVPSGRASSTRRTASARSRPRAPSASAPLERPRPDAQSRSWPDDGFGAPGAAGLDADGPPCWQVGKSEYWDWTGDPSGPIAPSAK